MPITKVRHVHLLFIAGSWFPLASLDGNVTWNIESTRHAPAYSDIQSVVQSDLQSDIPDWATLSQQYYLGEYEKQDLSLHFGWFSFHILSTSTTFYNEFRDLEVWYTSLVDRHLLPQPVRGKAFGKTTDSLIDRSNFLMSVRKQQDNKDASPRESCETQLTKETLSNIKALFWYYALCRTTKRTVLHYLLCRSFVHSPPWRSWRDGVRVSLPF